MVSTHNESFKNSVSALFLFVDPTRFELVTSSLQMRRSTN